MDEFNNIKDVDYIEVPDKTIRGEALYYSTSQVANILGLSDSKVRYYSTVFADILNIEFHNKQRRFTKTDIDKLRFLTELKEEGMTIKQMQQYCQEVDFDNGGEIQIKENNPLSIQTLAKALMEEQQYQLESFKKDIGELIKNHLDNHIQEVAKQNDEFKENISSVVDEVVSDKLSEFKSYIDQRESEYKERDTQMIDSLKTHLEETQRKYQENNSKKSFWSRLFNK